jgi:UDP-galactopyranose mutase
VGVQKLFDWLIVGAGFAGSVLAERLATQLKHSVLIIDRRPHIGGNAYDCHDAAGVLMHRYGPHIFHTNSADIFEYLSKFTEWRPYEHRVRAHVKGKLLPIPINRTTLNLLYNLKLRSDAEAEAFYESRREQIDDIRTSEDVVIDRVGRELYELFFRGYTRKQWGRDPAQLDKSVTARVPTRSNTDDRYFGDKFQFMPMHGYTRMFERMLDHPKISIMLQTDFAKIRKLVPFRNLIFTGAIDEYFDRCFGRLPYRSLRFEHVTYAKEKHQDVAVVNYPGDEPYTRASEYKHLTGQVHPCTTVTYEYPTDVGDPYYPIPCEENRALYREYEALAAAQAGVHFVGRLATYQYYNMDQVVGQSLSTYRRISRSHNGAAPEMADLGVVTA